MASTAAVLNIMVAANTAPASAQLAALQGQLGKTTAQANTTSASVGGLSKGGKMAAVGLAGAAVAAIGVGKALGASVRAASSFESTFAEVRKTVDTNETGFKRIERGLRNLAKEIPVPVEELNNLAGEAGALGIAAKDIVEFTRVASQLGTTTNLSSDEAANALARLANIMGTESSKFENLASALVGLGNAGASTESEITDMALRIASTGAQVGLTESQVLGFASALSSVGINAEAGGSAISKAFSLISRSVATGNDKLAGFAKVAQMSVPQFTKLFEKNAAQGMLAFIKGLGEIKKNGGNALVELEKLGINEVRLTNALLSAAGASDLFNDQLGLSAKAFKENRALAEEAEKRYETFSAQVQVLKNNFNDLLITVGLKVLPVLKKLVKEVNTILTDEALTGQEKFAKIFAKLTEVATQAFGKMAEAAAKAAPKIAVALVTGIAQSNIWAKLAAGALILKMFGGMGAVRKIGAFIGLNVGATMARGVSAGMAGGAAAGGAAAGGITGTLRGALGKIKWARVGAIGVGLFAADQILQGMSKGMGDEQSAGQKAFAAAMSKVWSSALDKVAENPEVENKIGTILEMAAGADGPVGALGQALGGLFDKSLASVKLKKSIGLEADFEIDESVAQKIKSGFDTLRSGALVNLEDIQRVVGRTGKVIKQTLGEDTAEGRRVLANNMRAAVDAIKMAEKNGTISAGKAKKEINKLYRQIRIVDPTRKQAEGVAKAWAQGFIKSRKVTRSGVENVIAEARQMPPKMRKLALQTMLAQVEAAKTAGKLAPKEYRKLKSRIFSEFGEIPRKSKSIMSRVAGIFGNSVSDAEKQTKGPAKRTSKNFEGVADSARKSARRIKTAFSGLPGPVRNAYSRLESYANSAAQAFGSNERVSLSFRRGGMAKFSGPGLVPAMVSPGELISYKGREVYVPGRPEPRDSVRMNLPPGAKVFTFDGQARLAMGASQNEALKKQAPHFANGGIVANAPKPKLVGGARVPRATGQSAIDRGREQAMDWVKKLKPTLNMITRIASGFGLQMTSGYRAGDDGYHGVDRARDYSNSDGPTREMFKFGTYVANNFQKHLLELIYTPLGFGIKNGARTAPYAAADHYDHVHVAMRNGGVIPRFKKGGWVKTGYTVFDDAGGGYLGHLQQGRGYAELGTATKGGQATGRGYIAQALGMSGELRDKFPLDVMINGNKLKMFKRDRGYGQGTPAYSIDIYKDSWDEFGIGGNSKGSAMIRKSATAKQIAKTREAARKLIQRIRGARRKGGVTGFLDAARKNAGKALGLAGDGEIDLARDRISKGHRQVRKAMKGKKPGKPGTPGGGGGSATDLNAMRRAIAFLEEEIELMEQNFGADWSTGGSALDPENWDGNVGIPGGSERGQLIAKNEALYKKLEELRKAVQQKIKNLVKKVASLQANIQKAQEKIADFQKNIKKSSDKKKIEGWKKDIKKQRNKIGKWRDQLSSARSTLGDFKSELDDLQGITGQGGKMGAVRFVLDTLKFQTPAEPTETGDSDSEIAELLRQQLAESQRALAISQAQMPIFQQFMPRFHQGGIVQGPMGAERPVMAQAGEGIFTREQMRAMGSQNITVVIEDAAIDADRIRVEVDGVIQDKISTVRRQGSNRRFATR